MQAIKAINDKIFKDDRCAGQFPHLIHAWRMVSMTSMCLMMHTVGTSASAVTAFFIEEGHSMLLQSLCSRFICLQLP